MKATVVASIAIAIVACWCDLRSHRLPNVLTFGAAAAALVFRLATEGASGAASAAAGLGIGVLLFFPVFALRGMSAGDVKLLGAFGAWLGPIGVVWTAIYAGIAGGLFAIAVGLARGYLRTAFSNVWMLICHWRVAGLTPLDGMTLDTSRSIRLPYALPISVGMLLTLWLQ